MAASKTLVLITGANQGLGYFAAQQLAAMGKCHVLLGSRDMSKAHAAIAAMAADSGTDTSEITPLEIDITSDASIAAAAATVKASHGRLDVLINNAGVLGPSAPAQHAADSLGGTTLRQAYRDSYETNVFSHAVVTEAFLPLLRASDFADRRVVFTSSGLGSIKWAVDPGPFNANAFYPIYRSTKAAVNMQAACFSQTLKAEGIAVVAADPGYCSTSFNGFRGVKDPRDGAKVIVDLAVRGKGMELTGKFVSEEGEVPW